MGVQRFDDACRQLRLEARVPEDLPAYLHPGAGACNGAVESRRQDVRGDHGQGPPRTDEHEVAELPGGPDGVDVRLRCKPVVSVGAVDVEEYGPRPLGLAGHAGAPSSNAGTPHPIGVHFSVGENSAAFRQN